MTTDPSGFITDINKEMEELTGCTRDELIGSPFKSHFTDADCAEVGIKLVLSENRLRVGCVRSRWQADRRVLQRNDLLRSRAHASGRVRRGA